MPLEPGHLVETLGARLPWGRRWLFPALCGRQPLPTAPGWVGVCRKLGPHGEAQGRAAPWRT